MELLIAVVGLLAVTLLYTLFVRAGDIPSPEPVSPTQYLDEKKAAIYENLRDLQFEYRVGKLSDVDYQETKLSLQKELAVVIGEINRITGAAAPLAVSAKAPASSATPASASAKTPVAESVVSARARAPVSVRPPDPNAGFVCPHCGHELPVPMKFCGECGKEMA
jgi:zinc-ribbon domain